MRKSTGYNDQLPGCGLHADLLYDMYIKDQKRGPGLKELAAKYLDEGAWIDMFHDSDYSLIEPPLR